MNVNKIKKTISKNAPEILLACSAVTGTACVVTVARSGCKASKIKNLTTSNMKDIEADLETGIITEDEAKKQVRKEFGSAALEYCKLYSVPAVLYLSTVGMVFASYTIQKKRTLALSTALTAATGAYATLLNKLKNGAKHNLTAQEILDGVEVRETVDTETGEVITEKVQGEEVKGLYEYTFDHHSTEWVSDQFQNECTLKAEENWVNDKLRLEGFVFLNEVLDRLGLPKNKAGQIVGWRYKGDGDGYVDFGLTVDPLDDNKYHLNFNVDGNILQTMD